MEVSVNLALTLRRVAIGIGTSDLLNQADYRRMCVSWDHGPWLKFALLTERASSAGKCGRRKLMSTVTTGRGQVWKD